MKLKSSSILLAAGLIYGAFIGYIVNNSDNTDSLYGVQHMSAVRFEEKDKHTEQNIVFARIETPKNIMKHIPSDLEKRCPKWESKFAEHELPGELFSYIAWKESRCNAKAHNTTLNRDGSQDLGLVQINSTWRTVTRNICGTSIDGLFNVDCNLKVAKYLYENGGARHWSIGK